MKKYLFIFIAAMVIVGCGKKGVNLKAQFQKLDAEAEAAYYAAETEEQQKSIYQAYLNECYQLLKVNMGAPYSDTLFMSVMAFLSEEQQDTLFDIMPASMKESENMVEAYKVYQIKKRLSVGNPYTDFTAVTPEGKELSLRELVGKTDYVLIDFWASWCGPCRRLIPVLKEIYARQPQGHLQILSCSLDQSESDWRKALEEEQMPWMQAREDAEHECSDLYGVQYIPFTVLIDKDGNIAAVNPKEPELEAILIGE